MTSPANKTMSQQAEHKNFHARSYLYLPVSSLVDVVAEQ